MAERHAPRLPRLRLRITAAAERAIRSGHPWVYDQSILEVNRPGVAGEVAVVYDRADKFLALGWFDPDSPLRFRVLHVGKPVQLSDEWWRERFLQAVNPRTEFFQSTQTNGYRCINGENDGWPGFVLDRYADAYVVKIYSPVWLPYLNQDPLPGSAQTLTAFLRENLASPRIILRLSRNIQEVAKRFGCSDGQDLFPTLDSSEQVVFVENGIRFHADIVRGQKTGFYLDQRDNRRRVGERCRGKSVLNAFSFSGGFSLFAALGGATSVTDLDISGHALTAAERNFNLNLDHSAIKSCPHRSIQADVFEWLENHREGFDVIILDPPSMARRELERERAIAAYERLTRLGIQHLNAGGILLSASCSAHVSSDEFYQAVRKTARNSGHIWEELGTFGHAMDHPANFPEAHYLKAIYLRQTDRHH